VHSSAFCVGQYWSGLVYRGLDCLWWSLLVLVGLHCCCF